MSGERAGISQGAVDPGDGARARERAETGAAILRARAATLARRAEDPAGEGERLQVVAFRLARELFGVEQSYVREVQFLKELTPLPRTPAFLRGVINRRGQILPVIDIKRFFDLPEEGIGDLHLVIVVQSQGVEVGILADAIDGVEEIMAAGLQSSLPTLTGIRATFLKGVTGDQRVILDVAKILADPSLVVDDPAEPGRS